MSNRAFLAVAATLLAACASGGPAPGESGPAGQSFRYGVPTPSTATYRMADTMTIVMSMPDGEMDMAMSNASTIELTFGEDAGGVRVTGAITDYSSSVASSVLGNLDLGGGGVSGDLEFVIGPLGDVEMVSTPEIESSELPVPTPFQFSPRDLFPRFPERPLRPGDTWADTATSSMDMDEIELPVPLPIDGAAQETTIYNYTLAGDTVVDGRTLKKITVTSAASQQGAAEAVGEEFAGDMTSTVEGFVLWDSERGLVAAVDLVRSMHGSVSMMGMSLTMSMAGPSTLRLLN